MWLLSLLSLETWILLLSVFLLIRVFIQHKWSVFKKLRIPHDAPRLYTLGTMTPSFKKDPFFNYNITQKEKFGSIWGEYFLLEPSIVIYDLEMMREIYTKEFQNFPHRTKNLTKLNGEYVNEGLTVIRGNQWRRIRSTLTPAFSSGKLKSMFNVMQICTDRTVDALKIACNEKEGNFVARLIFSNLSLDVILSTVMGVDCKVQSSGSRVSKEVRNIFEGSFVGPLAIICFMLPQMEWVFEKLGIGLFPKFSMNFLTSVIKSIIAERKESGEEYTDLLQLMLNAEVLEKEINDNCTSGISEKEMIGNAILMVGAGFENTANSMAFLAYNFAFHPETQEKCRREIEDAFEANGKFDYDTVKNLKYLDMCVNESLRLYTPLVENSRVAVKDTIINGWMIPKGFLVRFPTFALCHDSDYWKDPWEFRPERMTDMSEIDPMIYQPFGAGPRNCIALRFALMEIKLAFCKILHNFTLEFCESTPKPPLELSMGFGVRSVEKFHLKAIPRKKFLTCISINYQVLN